MLIQILIGLGLIAALAFLPLARGGNTMPRTLIKTIPLCAFALAGIVASAPWLLVAGLALSAVGDFMLSRDGEPSFLIGLVAFAVAHLAYIANFSLAAGLWPWQALFIATIPALILLAIVVSTETWLAPHAGDMRWPIRGYALVIGLMGWSALLEPLGLGTLGAALFIASDLLLAIDLFRLKPDAPARKLTSYPLWALYIAGQFCLLLAGI